MVDAIEFKNQTEDDVINTFINHPTSTSSFKRHMIEVVLDNEIEQDPLKEISDHTIPTTTIYHNKPIEIEPGKTLNINSNLSHDQQQKLTQFLLKHKKYLVTIDCGRFP